MFRQKNIFADVIRCQRDSGTGVFLWILRNFSEHLFFTEDLRWLLLKIVKTKKS